VAIVDQFRDAKIDHSAELARLLTDVMAAEQLVDHVHDDYDTGNNEVTERIQDKAVRDERIARDALIAWLVATYPGRGGPIAVVLPDGGIVTYCTDADGLSVVAPENVHRIGSEPAAENNMS
jgi:hypothetical protein